MAVNHVVMHNSVYNTLIGHNPSLWIPESLPDYTCLDTRSSLG